MSDEFAYTDSIGGIDDETVDRMLDRYRRGLLTKEELDSFMELQRHRAEVRERALQAGRAPGREPEQP